MNQLIAVYNSIYIPSFDENEDEYIDKFWIEDSTSFERASDLVNASDLTNNQY